MGNTLLLEINRIHSLMGIISEAPISPFLELAKDMVQTFGKNIGKSKNQLFDEAITALKYAKNEEEAILALAKLSKSSPEIAEKILPKVMQNISPQLKGSLTDLENLLIQDLKKQEMTIEQVDEFIDNWVNTEVKTEFEGVKEILKQDIKNNVRNATRKINKPPTKKQADLVSKIQKVGSTWYTTLEKAGLNKYEIISVSKAMPFRKLRADVQLFAENLVNNNVMGLENAIEEMFGKLKTFTESLEQGNVDLNYIRDINVTLQSFKNNSKLDVDILRDEIIKSLKNARGVNGEKIDYGVLNKIDDYLKTNIPTDFKSPSWVSEFIPETTLGQFMEEITKTKIKFESRFWHILERGISLLTTGTFRKLDNFRNFWIKKGVPRGLLELYVVISVYSKIIIPFIGGLFISVVQAIWANSPKGEGKDYLERVWDLTMDKVGRALLPKDDDGTLNWFKALVPFNWYWDNLYNGWNSISKGEFKDIWAEFIGKGKELEENADELVKKASKTINKIEDTPLGFKAFILKDWIDPNTKKSQLTGNEIYGKQEIGRAHV